MLNVGGPELLIILLVALIFLGPQRLPDVARQLGQTVSSLRSLASGFQAEIEAATKTEAALKNDATSSMTLDGPTDQAQAIAKTQPGTDPEALKAAARQVEHASDDDTPVSAGGPEDLSPADDATDEEE